MAARRCRDNKDFLAFLAANAFLLVSPTLAIGHRRYDR